MGLTAGRGRFHLYAGAALLCTASVLSAQSPADGALAGHLFTASGSPAAYTLVLACDPETGLMQKGATGRDGEFFIPRLPPGEYILAIADSSLVLPLPGRYEVHLGEVTEAEARMVSRPAPVFLLGHSSGELLALPVDGGGWAALTLSAPAANLAGNDSVDSPEITFAGLPATQNTTRIDGVSGDESFSGSPAGSGVGEDVEAGEDEPADPAAGPGAGARALADGGRRSGSSYAFAESAVREFRVRSQSDAAEYGSALYGHGSGGIVTSVSRSGGTQFHGMVLYNLGDSAWAASNPFSVATTYVDGAIASTRVKPRDVQQQFGARISGPLVTQFADRAGTEAASRLSYMYAFEEQLRDYPAISSPASPEFYRLTATQSALLANRGVSSSATQSALNYLSSLTGPVPRRADQTVNFARLDWLRTVSTRAILEYNRVRWSNPGGARSGAVINRGAASLGSSYGSIDAAVARLLMFPTRRLTNELRLQYSHELQYEVPQQPLPQEPAVGPGGLAPEVSIGPDGFAFGTPAALGRHSYPDERRLEAADVAAWVRERHIIQLGGDFSEIRDSTESLSNAEGTFTYDSGTTNGHAGGLVDWITDYTFGVNSYPNGGCPSIYAARHDFCFRSFSQSFGQQSVTWHTQQRAAFFQDDWRVTQALTLHLGVRYEYELLPLPQQANPQLDAVFGSFASTSSFPEDGNNFGPRLAVAWQPFGAGRGAVRIGYGVYFGKVPGATIRAALLDTALPSSTTRIRITPTTETSCPQNPQVGFGYPCAFLALPTGVAAHSTSAMAFSRRFRMPSVQQGTLELEHAVGWGVLGSAAYVMNLDRQLASSVDMNIAPSTGVRAFQLQGGTGLPGARDGELFYIPVYSTRVNSTFGPVTAIMSNANASYNAVTLEARRGLGGRAGLGGTGRGLEFRLAWTWSKALDFAPESGGSPRSSSQFDPFQNRYDKGLSGLNYPHRIVATAIWSPRGVESGRAIRSLTDAWTLSAIFTESSGRGYSYMLFGGSRLTGGRETINGSGGSTVLPTCGRNTLRLRDTGNLDVRLTRTFRAGAKLRAQASADVFNLGNRVNYSGVTQRAYIAGTPGTIGAPAGVTPLVFQDAATIATEGLNTLPFGTLTDSGAGPARERRMQFGLRLQF